MEKLKTVLDVHLKHYSVLGYGLVTALTAGLERIFSTVVFQCPCNATWNLAYGLVFLLVPALALFFLGYLLSARTWRLLTGCCAPGPSARGPSAPGPSAPGSSAPGSSAPGSSAPRPSAPGPSAPRPSAPRPSAPRSRTCCCSGALRGVLVFAQLSGMAAVAPLTWVAVALLGGDFYECAASGSQVLARRLCSGHRDPNCTSLLPVVPCGDKQAKDVMGFQKDLKAQSQVAGWILIAAVIIGLVIFVSITRCRSPVSFLQLSFWKIYLEQEQKIFKNQAKEHAAKLAENNVKCFFEPSHQKEECKTPSKEAWEQISSLYTFNPTEQHYSVLHKYVTRKEEISGVTCPKGEVMVSALSFVDDHGLSTTVGL